MKQTLEVIAGFKTGPDTNYVQLVALIQAMAKIALARGNQFDPDELGRWAVANQLDADANGIPARVAAIVRAERGA